MRCCPRCKIDKPLADYHKDRSTPEGHYHICKICYSKHRRDLYKKDPNMRTKSRDYGRIWRENNPDKRKALSLKKYGITLDYFLLMKKEQSDKCLICKENKHLYVDHCHNTGKVRGLLCSNCNTFLGLAKENISTLTEAINYIEKWRNNENKN